MNKLFEGIEKDQSNADIGWMKKKAPFYNEGYIKAARELSSDFQRRRVEEKDSLVFPIIFLYRQYIELTLKDLIRDLDSRIGHNRTDKILDRHELLPLWDVAIKQYNEFVAANNIALVFTSKIKREREIINQFNKIDAGSFSFKYATDKAGKESLQDIKFISINNFKEQIELIVNYLENMIETICHVDID